MSCDSSRSDFEKRWRKRFADFASRYDDDAGVAGWSRTGLQTRLRFFESLWRGPTRRGVFIDVGCGAGTYCRWLADHGLHVIGVDYSPPALHKAQRQGSSAIAYCAADASRLPLRDGIADGLLCFGVLQAVSQSDPFVREAARVLRRGGDLWIDGLNARGLRAAWDRASRRLRGKPMHLRYESPRALKATVAAAGFERVSLHWLLMMPARFAALQKFCESKPIQAVIQHVPLLGPLLSHSFVIHATRAPTR